MLASHPSKFYGPKYVYQNNLEHMVQRFAGIQQQTSDKMGKIKSLKSSQNCNVGNNDSNAVSNIRKFTILR